MVRGFEYVSTEYAKSGAESNNISLPSRGTSQAAGYDFFSPVSATIFPGHTLLIWTDVKAKIPLDECLKIYPRSSMAIKRNLILKNSVGIIDSDYYGNPDNDGNIAIPLWNIGDEPQSINKGERIAQGIFEKYYTSAKFISGTIRERSGGIGSSGL
jgi:dUTP pyrophosphatase